ncbi:UNKNOWN [Stylonychia lemnae]|uniref:Uncharacterized protein n=1 Tax=Stylonychia lemnae TaxID=5949 RepID=A0A078AJ45_STYLE|nr:UNKNOWN [Stylonychia lemnae]|eukprot:CDW82345.1 UNKNOWN [Stylonychia lemnae]
MELMSSSLLPPIVFKFDIQSSIQSQTINKPYFSQNRRYASLEPMERAKRLGGPPPVELLYNGNYVPPDGVSRVDLRQSEPVFNQYLSYDMQEEAKKAKMKKFNKKLKKIKRDLVVFQKQSPEPDHQTSQDFESDFVRKMNMHRSISQLQNENALLRDQLRSSMHRDPPEAADKDQNKWKKYYKDRYQANTVKQKMHGLHQMIENKDIQLNNRIAYENVHKLSPLAPFTLPSNPYNPLNPIYGMSPLGGSFNGAISYNTLGYNNNPYYMQRNPTYDYLQVQNKLLLDSFDDFYDEMAVPEKITDSVPNKTYKSLFANKR